MKCHSSKFWLALLLTLKWNKNHPHTYIRPRTATVLTTSQFTAGLAIFTLRLTVWTHYIAHRDLRFHGRNFLKPVHGDLVSFVTFPTGGITGIPWWTAMFMVRTAHCLKFRKKKIRHGALPNENLYYSKLYFTTENFLHEKYVTGDIILK